MKITFDRMKTRSRLAYMFQFGAIFGYSLFGGSHGEIFVWIATACIGSYLMVSKNALIQNPSTRRQVQLADAGITLLLTLMALLLPTTLGLLKPLLILIVMAIYLVIAMRQLFQGKLGVTP